MQRQLLRGLMIIGLAAAGAFAVHGAIAKSPADDIREQNTETYGTNSNAGDLGTDQQPAQLDRTYGTDDNTAMDQSTGMNEGTGGSGSGGVGAKATRMKHDAGMAGMDGGMMRDGGTGGAGMAGGATTDGGTRGGKGMRDGGTGGAGTAGEVNGSYGAGAAMGAGAGAAGAGNAGQETNPGDRVEDDRARQNDHTNIIIYGPNGVPAPNGESAEGTRSPTTHQQTQGAGATGTSAGGGTGGAGNAGVGTGTGEDTNTSGSQGPHTNIDVFGPNGR